MDDDGDWITARYLLASALGRNALVVDHVDEESFPVIDPPAPPSSSSDDDNSSAPLRRADAPPAVRAPRGVAGTVCAVCTEEIAVADPVARLPCAHWYHHGCIAPWLGIRPTCPLCRAEMPPPREAAEDEEAGAAAGRAKRAPHARTAASTSAGVAAGAAYECLAGGVVSG